MPDSIQTDPETRAEVVHAGVAFLAATVGWLLLGGLITAVIAAALRPDPSMPLEVAARLPAALALGAVLQTGGTLAVVLLLLRAFGRPASSAPARPVQVGLAALTGLTVGLLPGWIADRLRELAPSGESLLTVLQHTLPDAGLGPRLGLVLAICVLAPIAEELAFRGFLWTHLRRALSAPATLAITSVVFLLFHLDRLQTPSLLPTALLLGFLRWRTGSVLPAIAAHAANNVVGMVVLLALDPDRTPSIPLWSATLGTLASWSVALLPGSPAEDPMPTYRLLQARTPGDPVRDEERGSFAARLGVPVSDVLPYDCLSRRTDAREVADGVDAVLVGGSGKFSIFDPEPWLPAFIDALGALADDQVPMFASCFGFQGLVMALGGRVERDEDNAEVGTYALDVTGASADDPVFRGMPARFNAQLGHKDRATVLPEACVLLASSPRCPYQAFRVGTNVYATQFHPELTHEENRFRFSRYFDDYAKVFGKSEAQSLLDSFLPSPEADGLLARFQELPWNR